MTKNILTSVAAASLLAVSLIAAEQEETYPLSISAMGGIMDFEGDEAVDEGDVYSLILGYALSDIHRIEAGVHLYDALKEDIRFNVYQQEYVSRLQENAGVSETDGWGLSLESVWRLGHTTRLDPHLALGIGFVDYADEFDDTPELTFRGGFGFLYHINDALALRADARAIVAGTDSEVNGIFSAGVSWTPAVSTAALGTRDSDGDGLSNADEKRVHGTDPANADSDYDGLSDGRELQELGTDPLKSDSDGGGVSDGHEVLSDKTDPMTRGDDAKRFEPAIAFEGTGAEIREEYYSELDIVGRVLGQGTFTRVTIEGHVFASAGDAARDISQKRAEAVRDYLASKWKLKAETVVRGLGDTQPRSTDAAANERIEIYAR